MKNNPTAPSGHVGSSDFLGVRVSDENPTADLMVTDHETGKSHYIRTGKLLELHAEAMERVRNGQDAWTRLSASIADNRARVTADTEAATFWVWWNPKTGGIGLGRIFGHRSHALAEAWLEQDGHELRSGRLSFSPNTEISHDRERK